VEWLFWEWSAPKQALKLTGGQGYVMLCHSILLHTLEYVHRNINILNDILYAHILMSLQYFILEN
jgi:hypothetical protein